MRWAAALLAVFALAFALPASAQDKVPPAPYAYKQLENPEQEAQAKALMETLRCLTCQSQSVADSDASMAGDVRNVVRQKIKAGEAPEAVRQWLVARYGDWISYDPPAHGSNLILWLLPVALFAIGVWTVLRRFARVGGDGPIREASLSPARGDDDDEWEEPSS